MYQEKQFTTAFLKRKRELLKEKRRERTEQQQQKEREQIEKLFKLFNFEF